MQITCNTYPYNTTKIAVSNQSGRKNTVNINANEKSENTVAFSRQTEPLYANYTKEDLVNNGVGDKDTFPDCNILKKYEKYFKVLKEHYSKVNEENKKFANPEKHINDKYFNEKSPYYIKGLTQKERQICANAELDVLHGKNPALNSDDPVIQKNFGGCNIFIMDMEYNQETREEINRIINQVFKENGITIPKGVNLRLTVDPYDFLIHVSGVDEELAKKIETVLNQGKNGYNLYNHILLCDPVNYGVAEPDQYIQGDKDKMVVYHFVKRMTGYDIRELENRDGKFFTPDGEDLLEVIDKKYNELLAGSKADASAFGEFKSAYQRIAKMGWNRTSDCCLSIDYKDGFLYDVDTTYGYGPGQTAWQDRVRRWYEGVQKEYLREREEELRKEENTLTKSEMAAGTENKTEVMFWQKDIYGTQDPISQLIPPNLSELQKILERLQKEGLLVPLTDKVLSLRGESVMIRSFDCKA
ncbi:MAG: hypothetical protein ACFWTJ_04035 [Lachnoclostridium sp.]|jgi:hypothetical protein